jgi:hypothetical protein
LASLAGWQGRKDVRGGLWFQKARASGFLSWEALLRLDPRLPSALRGRYSRAMPTASPSV